MFRTVQVYTYLFFITHQWRVVTSEGRWLNNRSGSTKNDNTGTSRSLSRLLLSTRTILLDTIKNLSYHGSLKSIEMLKVTQTQFKKNTLSV